MVAVGCGYDSVSNLEYAIVKNSWGKDWGTKGYIVVALTNDDKGMCGLYLDNVKAYFGCEKKKHAFEFMTIQFKNLHLFVFCCCLLIY